MRSNSDQDTYIIIPVHNRKEVTLECLENLEHIGALERYSVVVVDDGSTDGTAAAIASDFPVVSLLRGTGDLWWTGAIKVGMEHAYQQNASYIIWLNDDCFIAENTFEHIIQRCSEHSAIIGAQGYKFSLPTEVAFGGKIKTWKGFQLIDFPRKQIAACDLLSGNLVCIPRQVITSIGYPDPITTPHYGGDSLYLIRAKKAGFDLFVDTEHIIFDKGAQSSKLYPANWLTADGDSLYLIRLALTPQSGLSWQIWLRLNWEAYGYWGLVMFAKKYLSILLLTFVRFLPYSLRKSLVFDNSRRLDTNVSELS